MREVQQEGVVRHRLVPRGRTRPSLEPRLAHIALSVPHHEAGVVLDLPFEQPLQPRVLSEHILGHGVHVRVVYLIDGVKPVQVCTSVALGAVGKPSKT